MPVIMHCFTKTDMQKSKYTVHPQLSRICAQIYIFIVPLVG